MIINVSEAKAKLSKLVILPRHKRYRGYTIGGNHLIAQQ